MFIANKFVDGDTSLDEGHGLSSSLEGVQQLAHPEPTATSTYPVAVQWGEFLPGWGNQMGDVSVSSLHHRFRAW